MYLFDFEPRVFLSYELLFCLIYINSKRNPDIIMMVWGSQIKSKLIWTISKSIFKRNICFIIIDAYLPFAFLALSVLTGGDILSDIIGILSGHIFYFLKDIVPIQYQYDILKTPNLL